MKKEVDKYLARCLEYPQVKMERQHLVGLIHTLPILEWKWEVITLNFITGLPKTKKQNDSIVVVVDKLSKFAHFIPVQYTSKTIQIANVFMKDIFKLHGIPRVVISNRDVIFTYAF